jgi:hypothetical protein
VDGAQRNDRRQHVQVAEPIHQGDSEALGVGHIDFPPDILDAQHVTHAPRRQHPEVERRQHRSIAAPKRVVISARRQQVAPTLHLEMHDRHVQDHGSSQQKRIGIRDRAPQGILVVQSPDYR